MDLTPSQRKAVQHEGDNLQLIACAGSGKTEIVARRVVHLLDPENADHLVPANIVAFTFTDKAAAELKERIVTRTREKLGEVNGLAEMFVGTIHAFALDLVKTEDPKYLKYEVLNEVQQALFVDRLSKQSGLTASTDLSGKALRRYIDTRHFIQALSILREADVDKAKLAGCSVFKSLDTYRGLLEQHSYLDYSSILESAVGVLTNNNDLRQRLAERIKYVIVDEYQDVNPIQEAIVRSLHRLGARICVVGDDDQTIYQWRGSDVGNILKFAQRYPEVEQISLDENFRSSEGIVKTARPFIEKNKDRLLKAMTPTGTQEYEPGDIVALSFDSPQEEARYVVETAQALLGIAFREEGKERGLSWSDMAVLLRSVRVNAQPITKALEAAGVPFVVTGMNNLFGTAEAKAARQLFYFMGDRKHVDETDVDRAWIEADLDLDPAEVSAAVRDVVAAKAALTEPNQKRWSQYSIQQVFIRFLEKAGVREERVPHTRGEIVLYNLGKFSQVITDFESIHYHSDPVEKYATFADFLHHRAEDAYPEGWQDNQYASPDAVKIMTVHQAKGMQWPVVFVPVLLRNRFPAPRMGGKNVWHLIPRNGVKGQSRFEGTIEDERRLFYVAMTRSQKFLYLTSAPIPGKNNRYVHPSEFWFDILESRHVKRRNKPDYSSRKRTRPEPRASIANVVFSFSDLKYFFECPYQFKLRVLYGFNAPIHEALGYGKSLHDALAEVHARAINGDVADQAEVPRLIETHLRTPYARSLLRENLEKAANRVLSHYLTDNKNLFDKIEFSEKSIEINLGGGVSVVGRIDLVRRLDTGKVTIVDLKSSERAQAEAVTETQLHIYALGYQDLTGQSPNYVETYELEERRQKRRSVDDEFIKEVQSDVRRAADALRTSTLPATPVLRKCKACDYRGMCTAGRNVK